MNKRIDIFATIGTAPEDYSAREFNNEVKELGALDAHDTISLHIHSNGGIITEGIAIGAIIESCAAQFVCKIEGAALSIASYIAVKCGHVIMAQDAWFMIHNPSVGMSGESNDLRETADQLDNYKTQLVAAYQRKTGLNSGVIEKMMDSTKWMDSKEALKFGFVNEIAAEPAAKNNYIELDQFSNVPAALAAAYSPTEKEEPEMAASVKEIKSACAKATAEFIVNQIENERNIGDVIKNYAAAKAEEVEEMEKEKVTAEEELETLRAENEELKKRVEELEKPADEEDDEEEKTAPVAEEEEEEEEEKEETVAKNRGPIRRVKGRGKGKPVMSALNRWRGAVNQAKKDGAKNAADAANKAHPTLRAEMLDEVNR